MLIEKITSEVNVAAEINADYTTHTQGNGVNSTSPDNLLCDAVICAFLASQPNSPQLAQEDLEQLDPDDLEEMDLQWEMVMLTIKARRFIKRTERKLDINGQRVGFDKSKVECYNCHKHGHFARECRFPRNQENKGRENNSRTVPLETSTQNALIAQDRIGGYDWSYQAEEEQPTNHALMAFTSSRSSSSLDSESLNDLLESQVINKFKIGLGDAATAASPAVESFVNLTDKSRSDKGYHSVPPPLTRNYIQRKPDLTFIDQIVKSEHLDVTTVVTPCNVKTVENKGVSNTVETNTVRMNNTSAPIIEDWNSDDESEIDYTARPSTEKINFVKTVRETDAPKQHKHHPRGKQRNWNNLMSQRLGSNFKMINKACYVCGSFEHLHYVCDKKVVKPMWNNSRRVNHKNFSNKMTHPHPKRSFVPKAVLTRTGKINIVATNVNTAGAAVNTVRQVNTANTKAVNTGNPQQKEYKHKAVIDSGCSRQNFWYKNGVAEMKNRTLIEATRTMLVESKMPTTFWAEAVNTACYVLNKVLVIKPHNKTPYELICGRPPLIDFMKPFGCPVTILNTRDHLGKFNGKADEGYFVGYSVVSKAMRVFNKRTRIVEETLNIRFLENSPNMKGNGQEWLFDVDSLSISINYVPVAAGNKTNGIAGTKDNIVAGQAQKEKEPEQEYILIPICTTDPLISQGPKDCEGDAGIKPTEVDENEASDNSRKHDQEARSESGSTSVSTAEPTFDITVLSTPVNTAGSSISTANESEE
ncbi:ribonuclease H-like domain-containing protein [Tanacetum coccineum]